VNLNIYYVWNKINNQLQLTIYNLEITSYKLQLTILNIYFCARYTISYNSKYLFLVNDKKQITIA